ncbi:PAS domain S-box protein [Chromobacterium sphagni]|nr:PAS domain-containing protein [Chromobacterium sphagni]
MSNSSSWMKKRTLQRENAEAMVAGLFSESSTAEPAGFLMHELLVHKIELEAQIIELQNNNALVEFMRDQYADLYEAAAAGFISTDSKGIITEINKPACDILGADKINLIGMSVNRLISGADQKRWLLFFESALYAKEHAGKSIILALNSPRPTPRMVHVDCERKYLVGTGVALRLILTDYDKIKHAEAEMLSHSIEQ